MLLSLSVQPGTFSSYRAGMRSALTWNGQCTRSIRPSSCCPFGLGCAGFRFGIVLERHRFLCLRPASAHGTERPGIRRDAIGGSQ